MRGLRAVGAAALAVAVLWATPAAAENPVYDADTAADIAAGLAEATEVQGVCYSVVLDVSDPTGIYGGVYVVSSSGVDQAPATGSCTRGEVELRATILYASEYSEAADGASWFVATTLGGPTELDLERNGLRASALLDDAKSEEVWLNAALALPRLTAEVDRAVPPLVLTPATASPPADARATDRPGSDQLRQNRSSLIALGLVALGGLAWAFSLIRAARRPPPEYDYRQPYASGRVPVDPSPNVPGPEWF